MAEDEVGKLVVALQADISGFRSELLASQKVVASAADGIEKHLQDMADKGGKSFFDLSNIANTALGVGLADIVTGSLARIKDAAKELFDTMVIEGVAAASEQEDAIARLNQALAASGQFSKGASDALQNYASAVQMTTKFSDDATLNASALIQTLGQLKGPDALQGATQAALNMAAALGIDLNTAATLVGKAAAGEIGTFGRYGIALEEGSTKAETFSRALEALNSRFGGAAAAQVNTFSGATSLLSHSFGEMQESIGDTIVKNQAVIAVVKEGAKIFEEWNKGIKGNSASLKELVAEGILLAIDGTAGLVIALDTLLTGGKVVFYGLKGALDAFGLGLVTVIDGPIALLYKALSYLPGVGEEFAAKFDAMIATSGALAKNVNDDAAEIEKALAGPSSGAQAIQENLLRLREAAVTGFAAVKEGADTLPEPINNTKNALVELTAEQIRMGEEGKKLAESLLEFSPQTVMTQQLAELQLQRDLDLLSNEEYHAAQTLALKTRLADEQILLEAALSTKKIGDEQYQAAVLAAQKKTNDDLRKLNLQQQKEDQKNIETKFGYASQFFGDLSSLQKTKSKELYEIGKAAAVAQATVDGIAAVQKTLASVPYPFSIPLAVAAGVAAAANVASIVSASPPAFASGGIVPGMKTAGDKVDVRANSGEMILTGQQQSELLSIASGRAGGGGNSEPILLAILGRLQQMELRVQVAIGGRDIVDTLNAELAAGRRLVTA